MKFASKMIIGGSLSIGALVLAGCSSEDAGETAFDLTWTSYTSPTGYYGVAMEEWIDLVEERSDGRIQIEPFHGGSLCSSDDGLACVGDGRADIAYTSAAFHPAEFPLSTVVTVPFVASDPMAQTATIQRLYEENDAVQQEFSDQGVRPLYFAPVSASAVGTKTEANSYSDLENLSIRGTARMLPALEAAGANPSAIGVSEIYESMETGVIDAWSSTGLDDALTEWNLGEVTPYMTDPDSGAFINVMAVISDDVWNELPEDLQGVVAEANEEVWGSLQGDLLTDVLDETCAVAEEQDVILNTWDEEQTQQWREDVGDDLLNAWMAEAEGSGATDVESFYDEYLSVLSEEEEARDYVSPVQHCLDQGIGKE